MFSRNIGSTETVLLKFRTRGERIVHRQRDNGNPYQRIRRVLFDSLGRSSEGTDYLLVTKKLVTNNPKNVRVRIRGDG